jgi:hypothetical protein
MFRVVARTCAPRPAKGGIAVMSWKKIASLFAVSMSLGILSASCAAKVEDQGATPDAAEPADDGEALEAADCTATDLAREPIDPRRDRDHDRIERERDRREFERCNHICDERFRECLRISGRDRVRRERCERRVNDCRRECRMRSRF